MNRFSKFQRFEGASETARTSIRVPRATPEKTKEPKHSTRIKNQESDQRPEFFPNSSGISVHPPSRAPEDFESLVMRPGAGHRGGRFPPPDQQQPPSSRQPDEPRNTDQNPPAANDPRPYKKRGKQSPWHLAGVGEQNLAPPVTRTPPAEDSQRLNGKRKRKPTKELAGQGLQEQHPSVQTPQPHQQQQFSPFPSFFQHPLIFQTLHPKQQFSSFPSFVPQLMLFTVDGSPTSYDTVFEDLHPDSQKLLLKIEYGFFVFLFVLSCLLLLGFMNFGYGSLLFLDGCCFLAFFQDIVGYMPARFVFPFFFPFSILPHLVGL